MSSEYEESVKSARLEFSNTVTPVGGTADAFDRVHLHMTCPKWFLEEIDRQAEAIGSTRSAFIRQIMVQALRLAPPRK